MLFICFTLLFCTIFCNCQMLNKHDENFDEIPKIKIHFNDDRFTTASSSKQFVDYIYYFTRPQINDLNINEIKDELLVKPAIKNEPQEDLITHKSEVLINKIKNEENINMPCGSRQQIPNVKNIELRSLNDKNHDINHVSGSTNNPRRCKCMKTNPNPTCKHKCSGDLSLVNTKSTLCSRTPTEAQSQPIFASPYNVPMAYYPMVYYTPEMIYMTEMPKQKHKFDDMVYGEDDTKSDDSDSNEYEDNFDDNSDDSTTQKIIIEIEDESYGKNKIDHTSNKDKVNICMHGSVVTGGKNSKKNLIDKINYYLKKHKIDANVKKCYCSGVLRYKQHYFTYFLIFFIIIYNFEGLFI